MNRYQKRLNNRLALRAHTALILLGTVAFGFFFGRLLLQLGLSSPAIRNATVLTVSYAFFFLLIKVWISRFHRHAEKIISEEGFEESGIAEKNPKRAPKHSGWADIFDWGGLDLGEAGVVLLLIVVLVGCFFWIFAEGPIILSDAAFEVALSASLLRATKKMGRGDWTGSVFKKTAFPFFLVLVSSTIILALFEKQCPGQPTLHLMIKSCWR